MNMIAEKNEELEFAFYEQKILKIQENANKSR